MSAINYFDYYDLHCYIFRLLIGFIYINFMKCIPVKITYQLMKPRYFSAISKVKIGIDICCLIISFAVLLAQSSSEVEF